MRYNIRKMTYEDRFDRKYRCNAHRFLPDMKRSNRREFRRKIKNDLRKQIRSEEMTVLKPCPFCGGKEKIIRPIWFVTENGNPFEGTDYDWGWRCGACDYEYPLDFDDPDRPPDYNYCPHCGQKIKE